MRTTLLSTSLLLALAGSSQALPWTSPVLIGANPPPVPPCPLPPVRGRDASRPADRERFSKEALALRRKDIDNVPDRNEMNQWYPGIFDRYSRLCKLAEPEWDYKPFRFWSCVEVNLSQFWRTEKLATKLSQLARYTSPDRWPAKLEILKLKDDPFYQTLRYSTDVPRLVDFMQ
ncbi:hypothetical protein XA68_12450 [Ophiocordyceps unilateralis]|uniref:Uncharacterized protein n=1 Tax=Ophiocordyceps unilateralis TaxID=268505 RepID=A0A2A9PEG6_OPHUN|nr:hypothetical protein XA68_12450 [Ophiocordyceps unilateralis]